MADQSTLTLPDGYHGHTVDCDAEPIERHGAVYKLRVTGSYLIRWITRQDWEAAMCAAGLAESSTPPESGDVRWHQADLHLNQAADQQAALLTALDAVAWQPILPGQQRPVDPGCLAGLMSDEYDQFKAGAVLRRFRAGRVPVFAVGVSADYIAIEAHDNTAAGRYQSLWAKHDDHLVCLVSRRVSAVK